MSIIPDGYPSIEAARIDEAKAAEFIQRGGAEAHDKWRNNIIAGMKPEGAGPIVASTIVIEKKPKSHCPKADLEWAQWQSGLSDDDPTKLLLTNEVAEDGTISGFTFNANTGYDNLPPSWQVENSIAVQTTVDILREAQQAGKELSDEGVIIGMAAEVHECWEPRNEWQRAEKPWLFGPFDRLTPIEQLKDIVPVIDALAGLELVAPDHAKIITESIKDTLLGSKDL